MSLLNMYSLSSSNDQTLSKKSMQQIRPWVYKPKKSRFGTRRNFKYNGQHWTLAQNAKYLQFVKIYMDLIKGDQSQKRKYHLNRILSKFIGTRSPIQCRSHHQQMLKTYGSPQTIIRFLGSELQKLAEAQKFCWKDNMRTGQQKQPEQFKLLECQADNQLRNQDVKILIDFQMLDSRVIFGSLFDDIY